jgi:hypothetical protein
MIWIGCGAQETSGCQPLGYVVLHNSTSQAKLVTGAVTAQQTAYHLSELQLKSQQQYQLNSTITSVHADSLS